MRGAKGDNEAVFEGEGHVKADKSAGTFAEVSDVVLSVSHVVLYDHVTVSYAIVLILLNDEVVIDVTLCRLFQRAQDCAAIILAS